MNSHTERRREEIRRLLSSIEEETALLEALVDFAELELRRAFARGVRVSGHRAGDFRRAAPAS
jgi:hypothetical protein